MDMNDKLTLKGGVSVHMENPEKGFLTDCESGDVYEINSTSRLIIDKCDGNNSLLEIYNFLMGFDANSTINKDDIIDFANFLLESGLCLKV